MNRGLAEWLTRPGVARFIVAAATVVGIGAAAIATQVDHDDDVLAFLPQDDADVAAFREINRAFGGLDVAIVGIEADNPLDPELFDKLRGLTRDLNDAPEVKFALSLANVNDFSALPEGGIEIDLLVREVPTDVDGQRRLRQKVMSPRPGRGAADRAEWKSGHSIRFRRVWRRPARVRHPHQRRGARAVPGPLRVFRRRAVRGDVYLRQYAG